MDDMDIQTTTFLRSVEIMVPALLIVVNMSISGFRQVLCGLFRQWSLSRSFINVCKVRSTPIKICLNLKTLRRQAHAPIPITKKYIARSTEWPWLLQQPTLMFYEDPHCALEYLHIYSIKCSTSEQLDEWLIQSELDDSDMVWDKTQFAVGSSCILPPNTALDL